MGADTTSVMCQEYDPGHCAGLFFAAQVSVFREWREHRGHVMQFPPTGISLRQTCKGIHTYTHERKKEENPDRSDRGNRRPACTRLHTAALGERKRRGWEGHLLA